ncbi:MAG: bifunctional pyr operon transcriptional regulator/uracil phosphoribosyltransferase PyrR, partial [Proteobacteria bacterium]|nr:bifunctional pyr operon transcriptional regulator/uracil phosphoribosyltransferase PyrR [Pseudomonadota bacterium]
MQLPEADQLIATLAESMRPHVSPDTCLVGIHTGGVWLAERLHALLGLSEPLGSIDVSFYRDDYSAKGLHPQ